MIMKLYDLINVSRNDDRGFLAIDTFHTIFGFGQKVVIFGKNLVFF